MKLRISLIAISFVLSCCLKTGQDPPRSLEFTLNNLAWLEGLWTGVGFEGTVEEYWSAPAGKSITSMVRIVVAGQTRVIELRMLREDSQGVILTLKRFTHTLQPWEQAPLEYRLVGLSRSKAVFDCSTAQENLPDKIIYLLAKGKLTIEWQSSGKRTTKLNLAKAG